jgi:hypothetical protein
MQESAPACQNASLAAERHFKHAGTDLPRGAPLRIYRVEGKVNLYPVMHHQPG